MNIELEPKATMRKLDSTEELKEEQVIPIGEKDYKILIIYNQYDVLAVEHKERVLH